MDRRNKKKEGEKEGNKERRKEGRIKGQKDGRKDERKQGRLEKWTERGKKGKNKTGKKKTVVGWWDKKADVRPKEMDSMIE